MQNKIAVLAAYTDNLQELADIVIPNMERYCETNGYKLFTFKIIHSDIYYGFQKIDMLSGVLIANDVDIVLCVDLDTLITNHKIKIESFIDDTHDFYITKDVNGINAGSFVIKNTEWSKGFLDLILCNTNKFHCEQNVIEHYIDSPQCNGKIKILGHPSINSYKYDEYGSGWGAINREIEKPEHNEGNWEKGDFLLHLPGITNNRRIEIFKDLEKEIIL